MPSNADDQSVVWSTSDPLVATVDGSGTVTAVSTGNATVTVTTTDGGFTAQSTISVTDAPSTIRINAGGSGIIATDNQSDWEANTNTGSDAGASYSVNTGNIFNSNLLYIDRHNSIPAYIDENTYNALFSQERWDSGSSPEMEFSIPIANGMYDVNIFLGNSYGGTSTVGSRVFDIQIEEVLVKNDLDLITEFGHKSGGMLSFPVSVIDGVLNIALLHEVENPLINAIEITPSTTPALKSNLIVEKHNGIKLTVYPNPIIDELKIILNGYDSPIKQYGYQIFDVSGKLVKVSEGNEIESASSWRIDLNGIPSGVYNLIFQVNNNELLKTIRILKR